MVTKRISSTEAQNNFGRILDSVTRGRTRFIIERRGIPQVAVIGMEDLVETLSDSEQRRALLSLFESLSSKDEFGVVVKPSSK